MKIFKILIAIFPIGVSSLMSAEKENLADFARLVFKGGNVYSEEEIAAVSARTDWDAQQRLILQVQMLASADDTKRYARAIDLATEYIASGNVEWVKNYFKMQRGFLRLLSGDRETGNSELEELVDANTFRDLDQIQDPILEIMRIRQKNLSTYFNDVMSQSIGYHYLDFRKGGILPEKAYLYFNKIKAKELREKCIIQLKDRIGDDFEAIRASGGINSDITTGLKPRAETRDNLKHLEATKKQNKTVKDHVVEKSNTVPSNSFSLIVRLTIGALLLLISATTFYMFKSKSN